MKRLLGLLLALTLAWPVNAALIDNVKLTGGIDVIGSTANVKPVIHNSSYESVDSAASRVMAGLSAELAEDVQANLMFVYNTAWWGETTGDSLQDYQNWTRLAEANVVLYNLFNCFDLTVGRQFYGDVDSPVMYFGPQYGTMRAIGYAPVLSLEGAKLVYYDDFKTVTWLVARLKEGEYHVDGIDVEAIRTIYGVDMKMNFSDQIKAQVYGYGFKKGHKDPQEDYYLPYVSPDEYTGFYGAKLAYDGDLAMLSAEYARSFGGDRLIKEHANTPYLLKVDGALHLGSFTPRAGFYYENGLVSRYGNYWPGLLYSNHLFMSLYSYGNNENVSTLGVKEDRTQRIFNVGVDYEVGKWLFSLDGYSFQDRYAHHSPTLEADFVVTYRHNENVELFAGAAYAKLGGNPDFNIHTDFVTPLDNQDAHLFQIGTSIKF